jgi:hypothetical protein
MNEKKYETVPSGREAILMADDMGGQHPLLWRVKFGNVWILAHTDHDLLYYGVPCIIEVHEAPEC